MIGRGEGPWVRAELGTDLQPTPPLHHPPLPPSWGAAQHRASGAGDSAGRRGAPVPPYTTLRL